MMRLIITGKFTRQLASKQQPPAYHYRRCELFAIKMRLQLGGYLSLSLYFYHNFALNRAFGLQNSPGDCDSQRRFSYSALEKKQSPRVIFGLTSHYNIMSRIGVYYCMKRFLLLFLYITALLPATGQEQFNLEELNFPGKYGEKVKKIFLITEVPVFNKDTTLKNTIYLENGLRQHQFKNASEWDSLKNKIDTIHTINIIFSKYPLKNGVYTMLIPLLFNRLKTLFALDENLNDPNIQWKITLQTNCPTDKATSKLFHGIVIHYEPYCECDFKDKEKEKPAKAKKKTEFKRTTLGYMNEFYDLPDTLMDRLKITGKRSDKEKKLTTFLENKLEREADSLKDYTKEEYFKKSKDKLERYISFHTYTWDSTIFKVLERNKQWKNALVVCDWTGSMYPYGGQLLYWQLLNYKTSGLKYLTLFNDGDKKYSSEKIIGNTGGIYHGELKNIDYIFDLYNLVMYMGNGGDSQENDMEALLGAMNKFGDYDEIVLMADNTCVRDIQLLAKLNHPVHVIICGYQWDGGVNSQYFNIAMKTGGSLHTMEKDIEASYYKSLELEESNAFLKDSIKIKNNYCNNFYVEAPRYSFKSTIDTTVFRSIDKALEDDSENIILDLAGKNLNRIPRKITKIYSLIGLDLSKNEISRIPKVIERLNRIMVLNLENNQLDELPEEVFKLGNLKYLDVSNNQLVVLPNNLSSCRLMRSMDFSNNKLKELPRRFYFRKLQYLDLRNNQLEKLPSLSGCKALKKLDLSGNQLKKLPYSFYRMKQLEHLNLSKNNLTELPKNIHRLKKLKTLNIAGNPITDEEIERLRNVMPHVQIEL